MIGIPCNESGYKIIRVISVLMLGDNAGQNSILGMVESFSANHYCRFCCLNISQLKSLTTATNSNLRNKLNYAEHLLINNPSTTGIKEESIWNTLRYFHVTESSTTDIMHDISEGIMHYDMILILKHLIEIKIISITDLNYRLGKFNFQPKSLNKPPPIPRDILNRKKFPMSASEMFNFTVHFSYLIGDLVPETDEYWSLYIHLREIISISFSNVITEADSYYLEIVIEEHHDLYQKLSKLHLPPKFHLITHYPHKMRLLGPLKHFSSNILETAYQDYKKMAYNSKNRINLLSTFGLRKHIKVANILCNFNDILIPKIETSSQKVLKNI